MWDRVLCWLDNLFELGFGDPDAQFSKAGNFVITGPTTDWLLVCDSSRSATLSLRNIGAVDLEYAYHDEGTVGQILPVDEVLVYDKFKGNIYARNDLGTGGTIRWMIGARH